MNIKFAIITPVRNEEAHLKETIQSVLSQTIRPCEWVIVDDGSTDKTGSIIDEYASQYPWIRAVHRANRGYRKAGGGVVDAFNDGYEALACGDWDFIVKLDGDLSFAPDYFEKCSEEFQNDPKLGVGGGVICHLENGIQQLEECPSFHVRGATKIYRRKCWEAIGGFWPAPGWDTMDEVKASMLGWTTRSFPRLPLLHHRYTGTAEGVWNGFVKNGRANYICGYHPLFMLSKCILRLFRKPYVIGSAGLFYGFITGYLMRVPQVDDPETISYLRRQQISRLVGADTIWK
ncbi:MAG TPA: glycosyltransferase family A protein [Candidatus Acidoferrales bacterium]|nr:glycosyltransferase family A protein [Candidatus Acidoferrales bacterium]